MWAVLSMMSRQMGHCPSAAASRCPACCSWLVPAIAAKPVPSAGPPWHPTPCPAKRCAECLSSSGARDGRAKKSPESGERGEVRGSPHRPESGQPAPPTALHMCLLPSAPPGCAPPPLQHPPAPALPPGEACMARAGTGYLQEAVRGGEGTGWDPFSGDKGPPHPPQAHSPGTACAKAALPEEVHGPAGGCTLCMCTGRRSGTAATEATEEQ